MTACVASGIGKFGIAQSETATRVVIDSTREISSISPRLYGSFLEHLGRAIYEGIYDPKSKFADANGFRTDVMEEIKKLAVPIIRYPGGNFVSGYHWLDGVGPYKNRPTVLDRAWDTLETKSVRHQLIHHLGARGGGRTALRSQLWHSFGRGCRGTG